MGNSLLAVVWSLAAADRAEGRLDPKRAALARGQPIPGDGLDRAGRRRPPRELVHADPGVVFDQGWIVYSVGGVVYAAPPGPVPARLRLPRSVPRARDRAAASCTTRWWPANLMVARALTAATAGGQEAPMVAQDPKASLFRWRQRRLRHRLQMPGCRRSNVCTRRTRRRSRHRQLRAHVRSSTDRWTERDRTGQSLPLERRRRR